MCARIRSMQLDPRAVVVERRSERQIVLRSNNYMIPKFANHKSVTSRNLYLCDSNSMTDLAHWNQDRHRGSDRKLSLDACMKGWTGRTDSSLNTTQRTS